MDILGIGPLELLFIVILAILIFGPSDMVKAGRTLGRALRNLVTSPIWYSFKNASKKLRTLPTELMRDAGLDEDFKDINREIGEFRNLKPTILADDLNRQLRETTQKAAQDAAQEFPDWTTPPAEIKPEPVQPPEPPQEVSSDQPLPNPEKPE